MQQLLSPVYNLTLATLHHLSEEEEEDDDEDEGDRRRQKNEEEEELWDRSNTAATWMYKSSQWGVYISIWHTKKSTTEEDCTLVTLDVNRKLNCVSSQSSLRNSLREFYKKKKHNYTTKHLNVSDPQNNQSNTTSHHSRPMTAEHKHQWDVPERSGHDDDDDDDDDDEGGSSVRPPSGIFL